jgi:threonine dehydrogenase-like Zn-dependent dehydrogenase
MLAEGRIPVDALITATAPLEDAEAMFQALSARANPHLKVLLAPQQHAAQASA